MKKVNVDLHCHPSQKASFTKSHTPYEYIEFDTHIDVLGGFFKCSDDSSLVGDILDTQSSIEQLMKGEYGLVFWSIIGFERNFLELKHIQSAIKNETNADLDKDLLEEYRDRKISYYDFFSLEWQAMKKFVELNSEKYGIKLIDDISQLDKNKLNVFPAIESVHSLYDTTDDLAEEPDGDFLDRFKTFIQDEPVSYVTLNHLAHKGIFTHCYGAKLIPQDVVLKSGWVPVHMSDKGYSPVGDEIIEACIENHVGIDVKHLSYVGRQSVYDRLDKQDKPVRILASHMGIAGTSIANHFKEQLVRKNQELLFEPSPGHLLVKLNFRKPKGILKNNPLIRFNSQSINLYDEDIERIISLGGLIGISLDQRILGQGSSRCEFMTLQDFEKICEWVDMAPEDYLGMYRSRGEFIAATSGVGTEEVDEADERQRLRRKTKRIAQSIIHIMNIGKQVEGRKAWEHIAIGSDYDGLADAINSCKNASQLPGFKVELLEVLEDKIDDFSTVYGVEVEEVIQAIFEDNAIRFYQRTAMP